MEISQLEVLSEEERVNLKNLLSDLVDYLRLKKLSGTSGKLLPDEQTVLNSLISPERGDAIVSVVYTKHDRIVFISNRRNIEQPFVVMQKKDLSRYMGRRTIDGSRAELQDGQAGIFLCTIQDIEMLNSNDVKRYNLYSNYFGLSEKKLEVKRDPVLDELRRKPVDECTEEEKWIIYNNNWEMDHRVKEIEKDLFQFTLLYARYNQKEKEEKIILSPQKYKLAIAQLIRDIYPPGVKKSLMSDFPVDHKRMLESSHMYLNRLLEEIKNKKKSDKGDGFYGFLDELISFITEIIEEDPKFLRY